MGRKQSERGERIEGYRDTHSRRCSIPGISKTRRRTSVYFVVTIVLATLVSASANQLAFGSHTADSVKSSAIGRPSSLNSSALRVQAASSQSSTVIQAVSITGSSANYSVELVGRGFGDISESTPFVGDSQYLRIGDIAQYGHGEWGYTGDANLLTYDSWNNTNVEVSGLGASAGDALAIALWNPSTGEGAAWGGNVPGGSASGPVVTSVGFSGSGESLDIVVNGSGFGPRPAVLPLSGDLDNFYFMDAAAHCAAGSLKFDAGFEGWGVGVPDGVTLNYTSWNSSQIVISGFSGTYGEDCAILSSGSPVIFGIWNTNDSSIAGLQTAWGGLIAGPATGLSVNASASESSGPAPLNVTFESSAIGGTPPYHYNWTFGDGASGSGRSVYHVYTSTGTFTALVLVTDSAGFFAQATIEVVVYSSTVSGQNGTIDLGISGNPVTGPAPLETELAATATLGVPPYEFTWDFGDNSSLATGSQVNHTYSIPGVYIVSLQVNDSEGNHATTGIFVTVGGIACQAGRLLVLVTALHLNGTAPLAVEFTPAVACGNPIYRLLWNFGDGTAQVSTAGLFPVVHVYNSSGTYYPGVQVTDPSGDSGNWSARTSPLGTDVVVAASPPRPTPPTPTVSHSKGESQLVSIVASFTVSGIIAAFVIYLAVVPAGRGESSSASVPPKKATGIKRDVDSTETKRPSPGGDRGGDDWAERDDDNYRGTI